MQYSIPIMVYFILYSVFCILYCDLIGGMGIHFYKNASHGGDWIIQVVTIQCYDIDSYIFIINNYLVVDCSQRWIMRIG